MPGIQRYFKALDFVDKIFYFIFQLTIKQSKYNCSYDVFLLKNIYYLTTSQDKKQIVYHNIKIYKIDINAYKK